MTNQALTTAETITNKQIKALRDEAMAAGDMRQVDTCDVALASRESANDDGTPLVDSDGNPTTRTAARTECARVIADAQAQAPRVMNYETGAALVGTPSKELIEESEAASPTGAVGAYRDDAGVWQYVSASQEDFYRKQRGETVITVYVES